MLHRLGGLHMSVQWIPQTATSNATEISEDGSASPGNTSDALSIHMPDSTFRLLIELMEYIGCDMSYLPQDNSGDIVPGEVAREWVAKLVAA